MISISANSEKIEMVSIKQIIKTALVGTGLVATFCIGNELVKLRNEYLVQRHQQRIDTFLRSEQINLKVKARYESWPEDFPTTGGAQLYPNQSELGELVKAYKEGI